MYVILSYSVLYFSKVSYKKIHFQKFNIPETFILWVVATIKIRNLEQLPYKPICYSIWKRRNQKTIAKNDGCKGSEKLSWLITEIEVIHWELFMTVYQCNSKSPWLKWCFCPFTTTSMWKLLQDIPKYKLYVEMVWHTTGW